MCSASTCPQRVCAAAAAGCAASTNVGGRALRARRLDARGHCRQMADEPLNRLVRGRGRLLRGRLGFRRLDGLGFRPGRSHPVVPSTAGGIEILLAGGFSAGQCSTGRYGDSAFRGTRQRRQHLVCSRGQRRQRWGLVRLRLLGRGGDRRSVGDGRFRRRLPDPVGVGFGGRRRVGWPSDRIPSGPPRPLPAPLRRRLRCRARQLIRRRGQYRQMHP